MSRRYTLCFHDYLGYGGYNISFKRVFCSKKRLEWYKDHENLHFIISGWPKLYVADFTDYFKPCEYAMQIEAKK